MSVQTHVSQQTLTVLSFLSDSITPLSAFSKLRAPGAFLLESTEPDSKLARFSVASCEPKELISITQNKATILDTHSGQTHELDCTNPLELLAGRTASLTQKLNHSPELLAEIAHLPFVAGLVGFMSYQSISSLEAVERQSSNPLNVPDALFGLYDQCVVFDHLKRTLHVLSLRGSEAAHHLASRIFDPQTDEHKSVPRCCPQPALLTAACDAFADYQPAMSKERFLSLVETAKDFIAAGEIFQIVLSQRFTVPAPTDPLAAYRLLQTTNPSPYSYFLEFADFTYLGSSPETMVKCDGNEISATALAGTRLRAATPQKEALVEAELKSDEKEMAEHLMLVDLARNDIGRVAAPQTVTCGEIASIVKFSHVMHLSTQVKGQLARDKTAFDAVGSCFPAGTVSGAPKVRAMQILSRLETEQRGIYSGMVGYFDARGRCDTAIAIRSALIKAGQAHVSAGAGIVADSKPESEYEETRNKAKVVLTALAAARRLEEKQ